MAQKQKVQSVADFVMNVDDNLKPGQANLDQTVRLVTFDILDKKLILTITNRGENDKVNTRYWACPYENLPGGRDASMLPKPELVDFGQTVTFNLVLGAPGKSVSLRIFFNYGTAVSVVGSQKNAFATVTATMS